MFLVPLLQLARDKYFWSPPRLARIVWAVMTNIGRQINVFRLLARPPLQSLVFVDPQIPFKYLSRDYLVRGLSVCDRAACFTHHYGFMQSRFPAQMLRQTLQREYPLLEVEESGSRYTVSLGFSRREVREGELFLHLLVDGVCVYIMQFTIVPGSVVGSGAANVLLISRVQGMKGNYTRVHAATKAFREVAPPALLISVLQGFAAAFGIQEFAGVCATSQFSYTPDCADSFVEAYDNFFLELGASRSRASFYWSPLPLAEKSLDDIKNGHKARTRKKRAFKLEIAERVNQLIRTSN